MATANYNDKTYDYRDYWKHRSYENLAEDIALQKLLPKKGKNILDIGGGFGRLSSVYKTHFASYTIFDYSTKILDQAAEYCRSHEVAPVDFVQGDVYELVSRVTRKYDCAIMVRVAHHLENLDLALNNVNAVLDTNGVFILEFANKFHFKSVLVNYLKLNFAYFDKNPVSRTTNDVTFLNFHHKYVEELLAKNGFKVVRTLSVSNLRFGFIKNLLPTRVLATIESFTQNILASVYFGPSIFLKCVKVASAQPLTPNESSANI